MSWMGPVAKNAVKYGAKYGPHAKVAWEVGGKHVQAAARAKLDELAWRRKAFDHAGVTADGSVLRVVHDGDPVFVVFAGDEPVASYPRVEAALPDLVRRADLSKRVTPEEFRQRQLRARARRAGERVRRSHRAPGEEAGPAGFSPGPDSAGAGSTTS
jgi:hypothetical protein